MYLKFIVIAIYCRVGGRSVQENKETIVFKYGIIFEILWGFTFFTE